MTTRYVVDDDFQRPGCGQAHRGLHDHGNQDDEERRTIWPDELSNQAEHVMCSLGGFHCSRRRLSFSHIYRKPFLSNLLSGGRMDLGKIIQMNERGGGSKSHFTSRVGEPGLESWRERGVSTLGDSL